jgi:hypothetical protein
MMQTCQLDGGNKAGTMTVTTMPMQNEGKGVSGIMTMMPVQQGQQRLCNIGDGTSATRVMAPL